MAKWLNLCLIWTWIFRPAGMWLALWEVANFSQISGSLAFNLKVAKKGHTLMLEEKIWLKSISPFQPKGFLGCCRDSVWGSQASPHKTHLSTLLCLVHSWVGRGKSRYQAAPTQLGAWNCPKCIGMLKRWEFLLLEHHNPFSPKLYTLQRCQESTVLLATVKARLPLLDCQEDGGWFITPENMSPLL